MQAWNTGLADLRDWIKKDHIGILEMKVFLYVCAANCKFLCQRPMLTFVESPGALSTLLASVWLTGRKGRVVHRTVTQCGKFSGRCMGAGELGGRPLTPFLRT